MMQAKILRALQERVVTPVGGRPARIDARVIAATHRDLPALVAAGAFREDLYYRLNVVPIVLAPLRERAVDIVPLAEHFLRQAASGVAPKRLTPAAAAGLLAHAWPGNVRELRNAIARADVLVRGDVIDADDLDLFAAAREVFDPPEGDLPAAVAALETEMIRRALEGCGGNRAEAARRLNINRQLLYAKMQRYGLTATERPET
jgi:two-component system NtrC family response regulator